MAEADLRSVTALTKSVGVVLHSTALHWLYSALAREDLGYGLCIHRGPSHVRYFCPKRFNYKMERDAWNSHEWSTPQGRQIEIEAGQPLMQRHCNRCKRAFVENIASGERHAVYVSVFNFRRLPDLTTKQWLVDMCPGAPPSYDIEVRHRLIEHRVK